MIGLLVSFGLYVNLPSLRLIERQHSDLKIFFHPVNVLDHRKGQERREKDLGVNRLA
jgi:hypothetical protein